ncbi:CARDB domain-containing protein [Lentisphaera profundi]|uniref:CARDB domain-containing protein n=1 Tax=Lentisphaera profundi TaxID=1658616 RepID=A0ABY7VV78_9BACT|nr:CARDB domain-containing protein [Lentisphaera profundi]WDE97669.1 CARDB domain-containing protein [Lentisphaera profundi]
MRFFIIFFMFVIPLFADLEKGLDFILDKQNEYGLWSSDSEREFIDTLKVLEYLHLHKGAKEELSLQRSLLNIESLKNAKSISIYSALITLINDGGTQQINSLKNLDGAWGASAAKQSNPLDTLIVINTLLDHGETLVDGDLVLKYLVSAQLESGYWNLSNEASVSKLELSARVLQVLRRLDKQGLGSLALTQLMNDIVDLLKSNIRSNGHYALPNTKEELKTTAEVYKALASFEQPSLLINTYKLLLNSQAEDGSWSDKPEEKVYTTSLVLGVLGLMDIPDTTNIADLALLKQGISIDKSSVIVGDNVNLSVLIFNLGDVYADTAKVNFYLGDPRQGAELLETQTLSSLLPGKSVRAQYTLETEGMQFNPTYFIVVNEDKVIPESEFNNNIIAYKLNIQGLNDPVQVDGPDLYVDSSSLSFNGHGSDGNLLLLENSLLNISMNIANIGNQNSGVFRFELKDGAELLAQQQVTSIKPGEIRTITLPWKPLSGEHQISLVVDDLNAVDESYEDNNAANTSLTVIGADVAVIAKKLNEGLEVDPPAAAYENMVFTVATSHQNADIDLIVKNIDSSFQAQPVSMSVTGKYQWNTSTAPAGDYKVIAYFRSQEDDTLLDTAEANFELKSSIGLRKLTPYLSKTLIEGGNIQPIEIQLTLANASNINSQWSLLWKVEDSQSNEVLKSIKEMNVDLLATQMSRTVYLNEKIAGEFDQGGEYTVIVQASNGELNYEGKAKFSLVAPFDLTVSNKLLPAEVSPLGRARIKTELKLSASGGEGDLTLPYKVQAISQDPKEVIVDSAEVSLALKSKEVLNILGQQVPDGTRVAVYVPYGTLGGGEDSPMNMFQQQNPQIRLLTVFNEELNFTYTPRGGVLSANQTSVTVLEFYQVLEDQTETGKWQGKLIGTHEIYLRGE